MSKQIRVTVEEKHIKAGRRGQANSCPIALALNEQYDTEESHVSYKWCFVGPIGDHPYDLSRRAIKFIEDFDNGEKVEPATFVFKKSTR